MTQDSMTADGQGPAAPAPVDPWLERFHRGERAVIEECYREHFQLVSRAVGAVLAGADLETAVHEIFFQLLSSDGTRRSFRGGSFAAWLTTRCVTALWMATA